MVLEQAPGPRRHQHPDGIAAQRSAKRQQDQVADRPARSSPGARGIGAGPSGRRPEMAPPQTSAQTASSRNMVAATPEASARPETAGLRQFCRRTGGQEEHRHPDQRGQRPPQPRQQREKREMTVQELAGASRLVANDGIEQFHPRGRVMAGGQGEPEGRAVGDAGRHPDAKAIHRKLHARRLAGLARLPHDSPRPPQWRQL